MSRISTKKLISWFHLWPGLISSVIVFLVCITGTIAVYCDEIIDLSAGDARYVKEVKTEKLPTEELIQIVKKEFPDRRNLSYMVVSKDPERTVRFNTFSKDQGLRMVYVDPYNGQVLADDGTIYFFYILAHIHNSFLFGETGQWIVDIATIIFVLELLTGLFLWLPKKWSKTARDGALKIKWKSTGKRLNYDLHKVLVFYGLSVMLVLSLTGLLIAFEPLSHSVMKAFGAYTSHDWEKSLPQYNADAQPVLLNTIIDKAFAKNPNRNEIQVHTYKMDSSGYYMMRLADRVGLKSAQNTQPLVYDRYSGIEIPMPESTMKHEKIENLVWVLHMGNWMGSVGKFVTFLGGLIATSLPVTGFYIWWGKKKKKKKE